LNGIDEILINMKNEDVSYLLFDSAAQGKRGSPAPFLISCEKEHEFH